MTNSKRKKKAEKKAKKQLGQAPQPTAPPPEAQPGSITEQLAIAVPSPMVQDEPTPCASSQEPPALNHASHLLSPDAAPSPQLSQTSDYHPEVSEDKLVEALQQHLVVEEHDDTNTTSATEPVVAPETVAPIPYHLQGAHVTSDIYKMSNELAQKPLTRSKSTTNMQEQVEQDRQLDDPVLDNVGRPGGFRRYYVDQQQRQTEIDLPQEDVLSTTGSRYGAVSSPIPPPLKRTRHFLEFVAVNQYRNMYDSFAGEYLVDEDEGETDEEAAIHRPSLERAPLLGRKHSFVADKDKASTSKTFFLLLKAFVGSGILFLPKAFMNGGVLFSAIMLWVVAFVSLISFLLLIKCKDYVVGGFGDIGEATYGRWMRVAVLMSITLSQLGFVAGASSFIAENLSKAVHDINPNIYISPGMFLVISAVIMAPLVLIRKIAKLSFAAVIADVLIVLGLITLVCSDVMDLLYNNKVEGDTRWLAPGPNVEWIFNHYDYAVFIGTAIYAFEGIGLIIPIRDAMKHPEHFPRVLVTVMFIVATVLTLIGGLGYIANGSRTETVALLNLPNNWISHTIQIMYAIAMLLSNPLTFFPAVRIIEQGLFGYQTGRHDNKIKWAKNGLRISLLLLTLVVAWAASQQLDKFISLLGSVCCSPLSLIFPPLFHYKVAAHKRWQKIMDLTLATAGVGAMIFTLTQTIKAP
ncbi:hypothetical protein K450DRAFT_229112 [Umbelopsis ramanniana AG]|uniref:Amino acid transporter transmembrane domain-containing protein n=1 Tax=Umbelopsis ramanniana AG TaxID=1314678 RepID=A0AAD5HF78_UMBRA|nr:uncharacterized protein K450DRAFT_229112 [Umbelopsis ramanniana AG]KAI8582122.1 hypothetical protein K450DRAFT_229112 [Umbelopsis ramanniana AG]